MAIPYSLSSALKRFMTSSVAIASSASTTETAYAAV
jgi:hypothetical protein